MLFNQEITANGLEFEMKQKLSLVKVMLDCLVEDTNEVLRWEFEPYEYKKAIDSCNDLKRALIELDVFYDFYVHVHNLELEKEG